MTKRKEYSTPLKLLPGVTVEVTNSTVLVKGSKGELQRNFLNPRITIEKDNDSLKLFCKKGIKFSQVDKMLMNTYRAHIKNLFIGVTKGYHATLKVCSGHFPMTVAVEHNIVVIKNFLGEKVPRRVPILAGVKVKVDGDVIAVEGLDKERVGQTAASIEQGTRITNRDRRIFQDGCFITSKPGEEQ